MSCVRMRRGFWTLDFYEDGKRRVIQTKWKEGKDKVKADKQLAKCLLEAENGGFESPREQRNFKQLREAFFAQLKGTVREVTEGEYDSTVRTHLDAHFGTMKLRAITPQVVEQWRAWMLTRPHTNSRKKDSKLAVRTINRAFTLLSSMLNYAEGHRWITSNPCRRVTTLRQPPGHKRKMLDGNILAPDECLKLYAAAGSQRDRVLFRTAVETGMRQGELLGLRWGDVELGPTSASVYVRHSCRKRLESEVKTAAAFRTITIKTELVAELRRWKLACPKAKPGSAVQDLVFPNSDGGFEDAHNILNRHFHPALRRAGLRRIRFHDLRHTCASLMLAHNTPIKVVQAHLGHASAQITLDTYGHLMPGASSMGADGFAAAFGGYAVGTEGSGGAAASVPRTVLTHVYGDVPTATGTYHGR